MKKKTSSPKTAESGKLKKALSCWQLYILLIPALIWLIVFAYYPMYGLIIAFKDFKGRMGIMGSPWADPIFKYFKMFFSTSIAMTAIKNTIIIMTSNVGSRDVVKKSVQVGYSTVSKSATASATPRCEYRKALEQTFAPEFLNRIDDIVLFRTLELSDVQRIIELELQGLFERTRRLGYKVKITEGAKRRLATMGYESRYGVRSLKRTLMDNVEEPLSSLILDGKLHEGDTVAVESDKAHGVKRRVA